MQVNPAPCREEKTAGILYMERIFVGNLDNEVRVNFVWGFSPLVILFFGGGGGAGFVWLGNQCVTNFFFSTPPPLPLF